MGDLVFQIKYRIFQKPNFFGIIHNHTRILQLPYLAPLLGWILLKAFDIIDIWYGPLIFISWCLLPVFIWLFSWQKGTIELTEEGILLNNSEWGDLKFSNEMKLNGITKISSFPYKTTSLEISTKMLDLEIWGRKKKVAEIEEYIESITK